METKKKPMQKFMDMIMPSCEIISYKISESMDHDVSLADKIRIRTHIMMCNLCARYRQQLITVQKMIDNFYQQDSVEGESEQDIRLSEDARTKIIDNLNKQYK